MDCWNDRNDDYAAAPEGEDLTQAERLEELALARDDTQQVGDGTHSMGGDED